MAFCTECGRQLAAGAKFCFECGAQVNGPVSPRVEPRKTVYDGEIHRCPNCGDILDAYETICDACGYELRGRKASSVVETFATKLGQIESEPFVAPKGVKPGMVAYNMMRNEGRINLIRIFPIPNTKEDLFEFAIMAASNIETDYWSLTSSDKAISDAWQAKFEQAYQKAKICFGDDNNFETLHILYLQKMREKKSGALKNGFLIAICAVSPFVIVLTILLIMYLF